MRQEPRQHLTILGGGPAGLGVAYYALRAGHRFTLYEASYSLGGLSRTERLGAHGYDLGGHRLHDRDARVTADLKELLGEDLQPVSASSRIYDRGRFVPFPPTPLGVLHSTPFGELARVSLELVRTRLAQGPITTFEEFARRRFGPTLAQRYLITYSEKLWGLPAGQLAPDVATRRLEGMTLATLLRELVRPRRAAAHLDGNFLYPRGGFGQICQALAAPLPRGSVRTGARVERLVCEGNRVREIGLSGGEVVKPRGPILSTLPLPSLVRMLGGALPESLANAASSLRFRSLRLFFLRLRRASVSPYATIYCPDPDLCITRIHEPRNRSAALAPEGETGLVVEVPCFPGDALHVLPESVLLARVIRELASTGLVRASDVLESRHHWVPSAYPVYALGHADLVAELENGLAPLENLVLQGRAGRFWYSHLHDQLSAARDYVASLGDPAR
jgi:protoporphyrinogen oxidase